MAVDVVDAAGYSVIAGAVAVVLPVAVVDLAGVIVDDVKDHGEAELCAASISWMSSDTAWLAAVEYRFSGRKHVRGAIALAGSARGVGLEVRDGQEFDGIEAQLADVWQAILEVNEGRGGIWICDAIVATGERTDVELVDEEVFKGGRGEGGTVCVKETGSTI